MDNLRFADAFERVEHRHGNDWHPMSAEEDLHDPATADPERSWARGIIFRCQSCDDAIRVVPRRGQRSGAP